MSDRRVTTPSRAKADVGHPALLVACHAVRDSWKARVAIRRTLPDSWVTHSPFRGVLLVESDGDPVTLASQVARSRDPTIARVAAALTEVPSTRAEMLEAARAAAVSQIRAWDSFAVRAHKRGEHCYLEPAPVLERDAGARICIVRRSWTQPSPEAGAT